MNSSDTVVVIGGSSGMGLAVARRCLDAGASVVIAGRFAKRPGQPRPNSAARAGHNADRGLALELAPIRVNAVSPGWVDTPIWDQLATPEAKQARLSQMAAGLPGGRIAAPADIANAIGYLIDDDFVTGTVLHVEGGQLLV
jgi:NAD(P)-dependent dehydrogenase (short-subunit alcohol dehydrogenase family)